MCELYPGEFEAMEHNGRMDAIEPMYYPQVDGITPTVVAKSCDDCISRQAALDAIDRWCMGEGDEGIYTIVEKLPSVTPKTKTGHCTNCKWWKDSDGMYRRGVHAESQCPINRREVLEGNGYCYMFEPQERG